MEKTNKIIIGVMVFGVVLPCAIILPLTHQQDMKAHDLAGIRDYKAGHYDVAIVELGGYLKAHPDSAHRGSVDDKPQYAQEYLGLALMKQRRYAEAVSAFRVYAQYEGGNEATYLLGVALFHNGNKTEARAKFEEVIHSEMGHGASTRDEHLVTSSENMIDKIDKSR